MLTATTHEPTTLDAWPEAVARLDDMSLEQVECLLIKRAMARCDGNVSKASRSLGISRSALYRRLQRYGIKTTSLYP